MAKATDFKPLSAIVGELPEGVSPVQFVKRYQEAVRTSTITAVPVGETFEFGGQRRGDDLVKSDAAFTEWHGRTVRELKVMRVRRGVVAHADDVLSGAVDVEALAARYRDQLNAQAKGRSAMKRPRPQAARPKPKLPATFSDDQLADQPQASGGEGKVSLTDEAPEQQQDAV